MQDFPRIEITSRAELRSWLSANHTRTGSVWIIRYKKSSPDKHVPVEDIVRECLCFGWIDSAVRTFDEHRSMNLISPRKPRSGWSAVNKRFIKQLVADGSMTPHGLQKINQAKLDGSWTKLDAVDNLIIPPDLAAALKTNSAAKGFFDAFPRSAKRGILEWILNAKTEPTRNRRVRETVRLAAKNIRALSKDAKSERPKSK